MERTMDRAALATGEARTEAIPAPALRLESILISDPVAQEVQAVPVLVLVREDMAALHLVAPWAIAKVAQAPTLPRCHRPAIHKVAGPILAILHLLTRIEDDSNDLTLREWVGRLQT